MVENLENEAALIAEYGKRELNLGQAGLPDEYYYTSVPQCVIDAVFSIGVRYEGVRNTVTRFSTYLGLALKRPGAEYPDIQAQLPVEEFLRSFDELGLDVYVSEVFGNRQRTSPTNGILKAEAVYRFCKVLQKYGINYLQDVKNLYGNEAFEAEIKAIPGQKSGISLVYFYMLAGDDQWVKPDRMIVRFLEKALGRKVRIDEAQALLEKTVALLKSRYPELTPRLLDYEIWNYVRSLD